MWYLLKRGLSMLAILVILSAALFGLLSSMPGNPIDLLITSNPNIKPEDVIRLKKLRGLDKPWYVQYTRWIFGHPEPARPPLIVGIKTPLVIESGNDEVFIDVKDYIIDPNFAPNKEQLIDWLKIIWPSWDKSGVASDINAALSTDDVSAVLAILAQTDPIMQQKLVRLIEKNSVHNLRVSGLFGSTAQGFLVKQKIHDLKEPYLWFRVANEYGQEIFGKLRVALPFKRDDWFMPINTVVIENNDQAFSLDLKKYVHDTNNAHNLTFALVENSEGTITSDGIYKNQFKTSGQSAVLVSVTDNLHNQEHIAFLVEHGVVGHKHRYSRGFIYFFLGDKNALGFSQTYKRPVYDLLFGVQYVCGDGRVDPGETCDNGNSNPDALCTNKCFKTTDTVLTKADSYISASLSNSGRIGNTIQLMLPALLLSLLIAIPLGIFSAYRQYSFMDYVLNFMAFIGISLPVFWFGIMMVYLFAEYVPLFPAGGVQTPGIYGEGVPTIMWDRMRHAVLPTVVLSIFYVGRWLRYMRASMLEVLPKDYIRTARAKGLSEQAVVLKHAFRNALIPVVTVLALSIPTLFGGAVLTETVFSWPGIGRLQYEAVMGSDYYVAIVVFLVEAFLVMAGNLVADAMYVLVDPRMRKG